MSKILIIEDEKVMLKPLVEAFKKENFEVFTATNGEEGLEEAIYRRPDFILLDIILPGMDGITVMKKLRESGPFGKRVPIMLLTNLNINDKVEKRALEFYPSFYAVKTNWSLGEIVQKVKKQLETDNTE